MAKATPHHNAPTGDYLSPEALARAGVPVEHLKIGECILSRRPVLVTTVLGSCVSVTFHHVPTATGAIFHAMLPDSSMDRAGGVSPCKYVDSAIAAIVQRLDALGIPRKQLDLRLFGGGFTIEPEKKLHVRDVVDVGNKNVERARLELEKLRLQPSSEEVLGDRGRKLYFHTASGQVWMKYVDAPDQNESYRSFTAPAPESPTA